jgi:hypothetical protein
MHLLSNYANIDMALHEIDAFFSFTAITDASLGLGKEKFRSTAVNSVWNSREQ